MSEDFEGTKDDLDKELPTGSEGHLEDVYKRQFKCNVERLSIGTDKLKSTVSRIERPDTRISEK